MFENFLQSENADRISLECFDERRVAFPCVGFSFDKGDRCDVSKFCLAGDCFDGGEKTLQSSVEPLVRENASNPLALT